jgi:hypothetical protein
MPMGSVEGVQRHVAEVVRTLAPGGGYIFAIEDIWVGAPSGLRRGNHTVPMS